MNRPHDRDCAHCETMREIRARIELGFVEDVWKENRVECDKRWGDIVSKCDTRDAQTCV